MRPPGTIPGFRLGSREIPPASVSLGAFFPPEPQPTYMQQDQNPQSSKREAGSTYMEQDQNPQPFKKRAESTASPSVPASAYAPAPSQAMVGRSGNSSPQLRHSSSFRVDEGFSEDTPVMEDFINGRSRFQAQGARWQLPEWMLKLDESVREGQSVILEGIAALSLFRRLTCRNLQKLHINWFEHFRHPI